VLLLLLLLLLLLKAIPTCEAAGAS
jgi:hypothetical protein